MILKSAKPIPIRDSKIFWNLDETVLPDMGKDKVLFCLQAALSYPSKTLNAIFEPVKTNSQITVHFRKSGNDVTFIKDQLGAAFPHVGSDFDYRADLYLNLDVNWLELHKQGGYSLPKVLSHEIFHIIGLGHCDNPKCNMFAQYRGNEGIWYCEKCNQDVRDFYKIGYDLSFLKQWIKVSDFIYHLNERDVLSLGKLIDIKTQPGFTKEHNVRAILKRLQ